MKYFLALSVFILGLAISIKSVASSEPVTKCVSDEGNGTKGGCEKKSKDWTHKRLEQVAAILPEPQKNPAQIVRPTTVKLISPKFLSPVSGTTAKLEWSDSAGAKFYHIQVSKDAGFNNRSMYLADEKWVKGNSFDVSNLESGQKYFWRVAAVNNDNDSMFTKSLFISSAFETK